MTKDATCSDDDFKGLLPVDHVPVAKADDVAQCKNGLFSNNTDFSETCNTAGGVQTWIATYGACMGGTVIIMKSSSSCDGHGDFQGMLPVDYAPPIEPYVAKVCGRDGARTRDLYRVM